MYEDKTLVCEDCGKEFIFSVGEQEFYAQKGLQNTPKRCQDCRKARKHKSKRRLYDATCSACGAETKVPFKPTVNYNESPYKEQLAAFVKSNPEKMGKIAKNAEQKTCLQICIKN